MSYQNFIKSLTMATLLVAGCGHHKSHTPPAENRDPAKQGEDKVAKIVDGIPSQHQKFVINFSWLSPPIKAEQYLSARVTFFTPDGKQPTSIANVVFDPEMPAMGHGTAVADQVITPDTTNKNMYLIKGVYFIMGGSWEIHLTATVNGVTDTVIFPAEVP